MESALAVREVETLTVPEHSLCAIPANDYPAFMALCADERCEIAVALDAFAQIEEAGARSLMHAIAAVSVSITSTHPDLRGFSPGTLGRKYRIWLHGGRKTDANGHEVGPFYAPRDWHFLLKDYNNGGAEMPRECVEFLVDEFSQTTRLNDVYGALQARLKQLWLKGEPIPGFGTMQEYYLRMGLVCPTGRFLRDRDLPPGLSKTNIWRTLRTALPRASERAAAQGQANRYANTEWGAKLLRDRSRLLPLQLWTIDDVRLDLQARCYIDGKWQIVYVDGLFALDVATGYILAFGLKPRATRGADTEAGREAGTKMSIDSRDVRYLLCEIFGRYGLPPWASKLLCENATAKPSGADETAFLALLKDRFEIDYTGMGRGQLLQSGFYEEWGRPGMKGWLENWFRLLHMMMNDLPGTVGRRFDSTRGDHEARVEYTQSLLRRAQKLVTGPLSPDLPLMQQLRFPILSMDEVTHIVGELVEVLNWRIDHRLQGFERIFEYHDPAGNWMSESALFQMPPDERDGLELIPRMEAPAERFMRLLAPHAEKFSKVDKSTLSALYLEKRTATVKGGRISIQDQRLGMERLIFAAADLHELDAFEGKPDAVLAYISPDIQFAVLADAASGARIATLKREGRVDMLDEDEIGKRAGAVRREYDAELAHIRTFLAPQERELAAMRDNNERVLAPTTRCDVVDAFVEATETHRRDLAAKPTAADKRRRNNEQKSRWARQAELARADRANPDNL